MLGAPNRWVSSVGSLRLVENAIRYLGRGAVSGKVGVLTLPVDADS